LKLGEKQSNLVMREMKRVILKIVRNMEKYKKMSSVNSLEIKELLQMT